MRVGRLVWFVSLVVLAWPAAAHEEEPPMLLGPITPAQLDEEPFSEWSRKGYDEYVPNAAVVDELRKRDPGAMTYRIFFATWCDDSRREVPRMLKLFDTLGVPGDRVHLVTLDRAPDAFKQSPGGEQRGREVYRIPTIIVERDGREVARMVEHPVLSLERDLLAILSGEVYRSSYEAYTVIRRWLAEGLLSDPNVSPWGLAGQLRGVVQGEGDLSAAGRVLESRGDLAEAIKLYETNCALYQESAGCHERLAEALLASGDAENAREHAQRALRYNDDPERLERLTELLEKLGKDSRP